MAQEIYGILQLWTLASGRHVRLSAFLRMPRRGSWAIRSSSVEGMRRWLSGILEHAVCRPRSALYLVLTRFLVFCFVLLQVPRELSLRVGRRESNGKQYSNRS
ncbi:unnamed protein product [Prorocentrum cordatum]|uniref:Uncharacterized protein n=1 Tax=Prorocentrum cordatum TaxID=2364126 RepID=A0ABN9WB67_9DINO|nr:unnamed protein product [Polarella glacialis]